MTTYFDDSRTKRGTVTTAYPSDALRCEGVNELAALALAKLASGRIESEFPTSTTSSQPLPHVTALARAMANPESDYAERMIDDLLNAGLTIRDLCLEHMAPAARELGRLWMCDHLPFTEVTIATARMQAVLRNLPNRSVAGISAVQLGGLFAAVPGETHTFGVLMAADHFRRLGWDVSVMVGASHDALCRRIIAEDRPILGLSCGGEHSRDALHRLIDHAQARRPDLTVVVSGAIAQDPVALAHLPECDGVIEDLETAEADLQSAMACARERHSQPVSAFAG